MQRHLAPSAITAASRPEERTASSRTSQVPFNQETTATLERFHFSRVHCCDLGLDTRTVHTFVPVFDHLLEFTTFNIFGHGANFQKFVPAEVRDLVANREVGQCLGTASHGVLQANSDRFVGASEEEEHMAFSKGSSFAIVMP